MPCRTTANWSAGPALCGGQGLFGTKNNARTRRGRAPLARQCCQTPLHRARLLPPPQARSLSGRAACRRPRRSPPPCGS